MSQSDLSYQTNQPKPNSDDIIAQLQQRIESQEYQLKEQARLIQTLEDRVVSAEFKASKAMLSNEQLSQLKKELLDFIADQLEHHRPASTTPDAKVTTQLESYRQTLNDLTRQLEKTQRYEEQIKLARTDFERLHKDVSWFKGELETLNQQVREKNQRLTFFEEQRRIDFQRLTELQSELPNLQKKIEANLFARIHVLEHQIPQFGEYELALEKMRQEMLRYRQNLEYQVTQRERQFKNWQEHTENYEQQMRKYVAELDKYADQYQANKRILETLQDLQEQLQRERHQTSELQRLTEERQQAAFEKWKTEYEQRWRQQGSVWKPAITDLERTIQSLQKQLTDIQKFNQAIEDQLDLVLKIIEEDIYHRTTVAESWQRRFEEMANES